MRVSVIFSRPCFILGDMGRGEKRASSGKAMAGVASLIGLALVWSIVWANLPSREELLSEQPAIPAAPVVPELDLSIPGVPAKPPGAPAVPTITGGFSVPREIRAKQIAEVKCDAEAQRVCPDSLMGAERLQCMAQHLKQLSQPCQHIVRERMAR
jgi:hypothetical protein